MVRLSKIKRSDEYWSIDYEFAGIDTAGEEAFTIACGGLKGAITSKRSQLVLIDDPIKSAASINNPDIRREMEQTWSNVIAPTMFQGARAICLGTRFHFDDIHWFVQRYSIQDARLALIFDVFVVALFTIS